MKSWPRSMRRRLLSLAIVPVDGGFAREPVYVRRFFKRELGFAETAVVFNIDELMSLGSPVS